MSKYLKKSHVKGLFGRYLSEFIDWRYSQSRWYFRLSFVNWAPQTVSLVQPSPPLFLCHWIPYSAGVSDHPQTKPGGGGGPPTEKKPAAKSLYRSIFLWRHFALLSIQLISPWCTLTISHTLRISLKYILLFFCMFGLLIVQVCVCIPGCLQCNT